MTKFTCKMFARTKGAIGINHDIVASVVMPDNATLEDVRLKLYDDYDHIHQLEITGREPQPGDTKE